MLSSVELIIIILRIIPLLGVFFLIRQSMQSWYLSTIYPSLCMRYRLWQKNCRWKRTTEWLILWTQKSLNNVRHPLIYTFQTSVGNEPRALTSIQLNPIYISIAAEYKSAAVKKRSERQITRRPWKRKPIRKKKEDFFLCVAVAESSCWDHSRWCGCFHMLEGESTENE